MSPVPVRIWTAKSPIRPSFFDELGAIGTGSTFSRRRVSSSRFCDQLPADLVVREESAPPGHLPPGLSRPSRRGGRRCRGRRARAPPGGPRRPRRSRGACGSVSRASDRAEPRGGLARPPARTSASAFSVAAGRSWVWAHEHCSRMFTWVYSVRVEAGTLGHRRGRSSCAASGSRSRRRSRRGLFSRISWTMHCWRRVRAGEHLDLGRHDVRLLADLLADLLRVDVVGDVPAALADERPRPCAGLAVGQGFGHAFASAS